MLGSVVVYAIYHPIIIPLPVTCAIRSLLVMVKHSQLGEFNCGSNQ